MTAQVDFKKKQWQNSQDEPGIRCRDRNFTALICSGFILIVQLKNISPPPPLCYLSNICNLAKPWNKTTRLPKATADFGCGRSACCGRSFPLIPATARVGYGQVLVPKKGTATEQRQCPCAGQAQTPDCRDLCFKAPKTQTKG